MFESDCRVGVLNSAFPSRAEPSDDVGRHNSENIQNGTAVCMMGVLEKNLVRGWFYSSREPKNIRVPPKFVIHSFVWLFSSQ